MRGRHSFGHGFDLQEVVDSSNFESVQIPNYTNTAKRFKGGSCLLTKKVQAQYMLVEHTNAGTQNLT